MHQPYTEAGDVHRFNLQSGHHRGAFKRTAEEEGKTAEAAAPAGPRRQLNLRGGAKSIWNIADQSYGMGGNANARTVGLCTRCVQM
jgi:hypothetical protein